jgi:hypothetical protein
MKRKTKHGKTDLTDIKADNLIKSIKGRVFRTGRETNIWKDIITNRLKKCET